MIGDSREKGDLSSWELSDSGLKARELTWDQLNLCFSSNDSWPDVWENYAYFLHDKKLFPVHRADGQCEPR